MDETPFTQESGPGGVASFGEFVVDTIVELSEEDVQQYEDEDWFPAPGESKVTDVPEYVREEAEDELPGGKAPNQAAAAALGGAETALYCGVGPDASMEELDAAGVDTDAVYENGKRTGRAYILLEEDGENRIACDFPEDPYTDGEYLDAVYDDIAEHDYVLLTNGVDTDVADELLARLDADGYEGDVVLDPSPLDDVERLLDHDSVGYITPNEHEHAELEDAIDADTYTVIETTAEGAYMDGDLHPAPDVDPVDTTGAGDTLAGYFAAGLAEGHDESDALQRAVEAASVAVTRPGAQPAIPSPEEVEAVLDG